MSSDKIEPPNPFLEAARMMTVCNSCRYCEGVCAVFPAIELRSDFSDSDVGYLANLCHGCGACLYDCQYSPPHEFKIDLPAALAQVRTETYKRSAWPHVFSGLFSSNISVTVGAGCLSIAIFLAALTWRNGSQTMMAADGGGLFYRLMPHTMMVMVFGAIFLFALLALVLGLRNFLRSTGSSNTPNEAGHGRALRDAGSLRYLGNEGGCMISEDRPADRRRLFHHFTFYGFLLCFASTSVATLYHYLLGWEAPYRWFDLPVILGTLGGIGLVVGTSGLALDNMRRDPALGSDAGMGKAFLLTLWLTGASGLLLLAFRSTGAMGFLLALHLGIVFALFATMPYGKFVHGIYRYAALVRNAREQKAQTHR